MWGSKDDNQYFPLNEEQPIDTGVKPRYESISLLLQFPSNLEKDS